MSNRTQKRTLGHPLLWKINQKTGDVEPVKGATFEEQIANQNKLKFPWLPGFGETRYTFLTRVYSKSSPWNDDRIYQVVPLIHSKSIQQILIESGESVEVTIGTTFRGQPTRIGTGQIVTLFETHVSFDHMHLDGGIPEGDSVLYYCHSSHGRDAENFHRGAVEVLKSLPSKDMLSFAVAMQGY